MKAQEETKVCVGTRNVTGCGEKKPITDFRVIRTNKTTGISYRERLCNKCRKQSRRVKKKADPVEEAALFKQANVAWN